MNEKAAGALVGVGLGLVGAFILGVIVTRILDEIFIIAPLRERVKNLEWNIYYLERDVEELRAGYTIMQSRVADIEKRVKNLENEIVELWERAKGIPEMREKLQKLYARLIEVKNRGI